MAAAFGAAFAAALAGLLAVALWKLGRRFFHFAVRHTKAAYLEWFAEAIDAHVQPQFDAIKQNTRTQAGQIKEEALAAAERVAIQAARDAEAFREDLLKHTQEEGRLVRDVVREEIAPMREDLFEMNKTVVGHLKSDEENFAAGREALTVGQTALVDELQQIKAAIAGNPKENP